tara:strand:- start:1127 stop:1480 length:354 start_codon:yes stop_codon:yes gene_type:complete
MNYEFIKLGKKDMPISFGFAALRNYSELTKTSLADLQKLGMEMTLNDALTLLWCGVKDGHRRAKQEFDLSIDDLADCLDGNFDILQTAFEIVGRQMSDGLTKTEKKPKAKGTKKGKS